MSNLTANVALVSETQQLALADLTPVAGALQKQVTRDFGPLWGIQATVTAFNTLEDVPVDYWPVIVEDNIDQPGAAGFHTDDNGQPMALVQFDDTWSLTVSHETLEMLADPSGNRVVAGAPPAQLAEAQAKKKEPKDLGVQRVNYLVEVCDPCEDGQFAYTSNGVQVSDFITPHYYDPSETTGAQYSFQGNIKAPHTVLEGGYVSFGNPVDNHWYQIIVENGVAQLRSLGVLNTKGKSLREAVDLEVRIIRRDEHYRTRKPMAAAAKAGAGGHGRVPFAGSSAARAQAIRGYIKGLK
jgi:hypothetical protein